MGAHLPLRQRRGSPYAGHGGCAEQQLQPLVHPGCRDTETADFLRLYPGVWLHAAHRYRPAQRDPLDQRLQCRADGRGRYEPLHRRFRSERIHHPHADGNRCGGHRQRRLPCHALCGGLHHRQRRQRCLPDRDKHPPPGHFRGRQPPAACHDGK